MHCTYTCNTCDKPLGNQIHEVEFGFSKHLNTLFHHGLQRGHYCNWTCALKAIEKAREEDARDWVRA